MNAEPREPVTLVRLQTLSAELAQAVATERRRRRRHEEALLTGEGLDRRAARLQRSIERVRDLLDQLQPLLRSARRDIAAPGTTPRATVARRAGRPLRSGSGAVITSAIDIGSNSVHLLVAVVSGHRLQPLVDSSEFLGLGAAVDEQGEIGEEILARLVRTLESYTRRAAALGSPRTLMVGTDPLRRAADAPRTLAAIKAATGQEVVVISHQEEAFLTLLGVTAGRPLRRHTILVDIGGGSSEALWVPTSGDPVAVGLPTGSARLTRRLIANDPPTPAEIEALLAEARRLLAEAPEAAPDDVVVVGGTATNLLRLVPAAALDRRLTAARVQGALQLLGRDTAAGVATRYGLKEPRARMMAAGAALVLAVIERYGVDRIRVDDNGIREGLALASVHAGDDWRQHLAWMAHGWSR